MMDFGLVDNWIKIHWPKSDVCEIGTKAEAKITTVGDTMGAFVFFAFGLTASFLVFLMELFYKRHLQRFKVMYTSFQN